MQRPKPDELRVWLCDVLPGLLDEAHRGLELSFLSESTQVEDGTTVFTLRDSARPRAVLLCSAPASPDLVLRGTLCARRAKEALGPSLGAALLDPVAEGRVNGLSFTVWPWCEPLSDSRVIWAVQRALLRRPLLEWLRRATEHTAVEVEPARVEEAYATPLRHLASTVGLGARLRTATQEALSRLERGTWRPRQVLMHGDLWKGNILIHPKGGAAPARWSGRFTIIDWPGSVVRGYGLYDLVRLGTSLRLTPGALRLEVESHSRALGCEPRDAVSHLLAALGHVGMNLEHFQPERFVRTAEGCYAALAAAAA